MNEPTPSLYAHNLVSSLYAMRGMIETFLLNQEERRFPTEKEAFQKSQEVLKRAFLKADQALQVVKRLGELQEKERGSPLEKTSLPEAWSGTLRLLVKEFSFETIEILNRIPDSFPLISCSKKDLKEILYHLLHNAFEALHGKGKLVIRAQVSFSTKEEPFTQIQIADTGPGISTEELPYLFSPFFTSRPEGEGNGLGLYLVRTLVRRNGGRIAVSSFQGSGTTFTLEFPLAK